MSVNATTWKFLADLDCDIGLSCKEDFNAGIDIRDGHLTIFYYLKNHAVFCFLLVNLCFSVEKLLWEKRFGTPKSPRQNTINSLAKTSN